MSSNKIAVKHELWRRGILVWKLDDNQKELYELYHNGKDKVNVWLLSRRLGKTYTLAVLALETCLRAPNQIVKFLSPTKIQVNNNLRPLFRRLLEDCPDDVKPELKEKDYIYYFKNGSEIQLAGSEGGHAEKLRGGDAHLVIVDEAGSCGDLEDIVKSILLPTTLMTKGKVLLASTPPTESEHDLLKFIEDADLRGTLIKKTIYDNPRLTKEDIEEAVKEAGGVHTEYFRREFLVEIIKDSSTSVIPEFTDDVASDIVKEWPKPAFYDAYVSMDVGFRDLTVVLFAYYDFRNAKLVVEDEIVVNEHSLSLKKLANDIRAKEVNLWKDSDHNPLKPYLRVSDIDLIVQSEISQHSGGQVTFISAKKDNKDAALNNLRMLIAAKKIVIHPRCQTLIRHLKNVKWRSPTNKTDYARSPDDGHYDAVDAMIYLCRTVQFNKNPYPYGFQQNIPEATIVSQGSVSTGKLSSPGASHNKQLEIYKTIFGYNRYNKR